MSAYRITFFKHLINSNGHEFKCPQGMIEVQKARTLQRAFLAAERRFERLNKIKHWSLRADLAEMQEVDAPSHNLEIWPLCHDAYRMQPSLNSDFDVARPVAS